MNKLFISIFTLLAAVLGAFGQLAKPSASLATMLDLRNRQPVNNEVIEVRHGGVSNLWLAPRIFTHYPLSTETADNVFVTTNKSNVGRYIASDRNGPFYDVAWFGIDPSANDNAAGWANVGSRANRLRWNIGSYRFSNVIRLTNASPVRWLAEAGAYQGGWISTNQVEKAELVYIGPSTNVFIDMVTGKDGSGNQMIRYGHSMENISVQANGLAQTALAVGHIGRLDMTAVRYNGATDTNFYVGQLQFGRFEDCSTSINDETPTPTVRARIGMALEGFSPVNTFVNCIWENSSEYAIVFGVNARNNTFIGGTVESNDGNGVYMGNGVTANTFIGTWFENNGGGTNLVLEVGSYWNTFIGLRMFEDNLCTTYVAGSYNTFMDCQLSSVYIHPSGTRNKWINCVYGGTFTDLSSGGQTYFDFIDPTATIRTNTFSSPFVMYGDYFKLWSTTNLYERAKLTYDSIEFGDGSNPTDAKIQRVSANTLQTPNELRVFRNGVTDVAFSTFTPGDAFTRLTLDSQGIFVGPGSATRDTWWKRNDISNWLTEAQTWFARQATNDIAIATLLPGNAFLPFTIRGDGRLDWGTGSALRDSSIERTAPGTLTLRTNVEVQGTIALNNVRHRTWTPNWVNVTDPPYNAVGDAVTDDTAALQAAIAAVPAGGTLYAPPGLTFLTTGRIQNTNSWVNIDFSGSTLRSFVPSRMPVIQIGPSAILLSGLNFALDPTTNKITVPAGTFAPGDMVGLYNHVESPQDYYPGQFAFVTAVSGTTVTLDRFPSAALLVTNAYRYVAAPANCTVRNVNIDLSNAVEDGIGILVAGRGHVVENCRVNGDGTPADKNYIGIGLTGQALTARNNYVIGILDAGNADDRSGYGIFMEGDSITIENNEVHDCKHTIATSSRAFRSTRLRMLNNICRQRGDWEILTDGNGAFIFSGNLDVHANVDNVLIQGNYCDSWGRWNAGIRNGNFDVIDNYFVIHTQEGLPFSQQQLGFNEAFTTRGVIRGNHFITPDGSLITYFGHLGTGFTGSHSNIIVSGNTFEGGILCFQDFSGTNSNPFSGVSIVGNQLGRPSRGTPLLLLGTMREFLVANNLLRYGTNGNGITINADGDPTNNTPARQIYIVGNHFMKEEGGTGYDVNVIGGPTNIVALGENRWSASPLSYVGTLKGIDSALPVGLYNSRDTYPRIIGTDTGKLKFGPGTSYPYSSLSLLYPGALVTDSILAVNTPSPDAPAFTAYSGAFSNLWDFAIRGDGVMAYRYIDTTDTNNITTNTPIVIGPQRYMDMTGSVWRVSASLGLTMRSDPIVPQQDTATVWLEEANTNKSIKVKWPDGANTVLYPQMQSVQIDVLTNATGTWTKPTGAKFLHIFAFGAGGGGGSGARGTNSIAGGGAGGAGAGMVEWTFNAAYVPTSVAYTNGTGGAGGLAQTSDTQPGLPGGSGGATLFGALILVPGGPGGPGGTNNNGAAPNGGVSQSAMYSGLNGGAGTTTAATAPASLSNRPGGSTGGGGGGAIAVATTNAPALGGYIYGPLVVPGGTPGTTSSGAGGAGSTWTPSAAAMPRPGTGGGGGCADAGGSGSGGAGGFPGGGGGGGSGSKNGTSSGAGGKGGDGLIVIVTHF